MRRGVHLWAAGALTLSGACDWFDSGRVCNEGETSCDGASVRVCVARQDVPEGADGPQTKWQHTRTCSSSSLGPATCAVVRGEAACVALDAANGDASAAAQSFWLRVDVSSDDAGTLSLSSISKQTVEGMPASASRGAVAAVAYNGDTIVDAALVPSYEGASLASAWVRADHVTRVDLVDPKGNVVATEAVSATATSASGLTVARREQALEAPLPPTVRVIDPTEIVRVPRSLSKWDVRQVRPTDEQLWLVGSVLRQLPATVMTAVPAVAFVSQNRSALETPGDAGAAGLGHGDGDGDGGLVLVGAESELMARGPLARMRSAFSGTTLFVDVSESLLSLYRESDAERSAFAVELVQRVGEAYATLAIATTQDQALLGGSSEKARPARDYPPKITAALRRRVVPLLGPLDTFEDAWAGLHDAAVEARIAEAYVHVFGRTVETDAEAVSAGFASALGQESVTEDFATFLAYGTLPDAWSSGPCRALRASPVDQLDPRLFVPLTKLHVLWGLGVLSKDALTKCVGDLPMSSASKPGITVHLADGQRVLFDEEASGTRTAYVHSETHVTALAGAGDMHAAVDLMYSGEAPEIARLTPVLNIRAQEVGATFALSDVGDYGSSPSKGGLLMMTKVTEDSMEGLVFMAVMGGDLLGQRMFPLVTIRLKKEQIQWPTISYEGDDAP